MKQSVTLDWTGSLVLDAIGQTIVKAPYPEVATEIAKRCSESIGRHLIFLTITASDTMLHNRYSVGLALFRHMEDALDCYSAVSLIENAAEKWANGNLRASEAAKLCEPKLGDVFLPTGEKTVNYRGTLRTYFNNFAHCSPYLTDWNIYPELDSASREKVSREPDRDHTLSVEFRVNHGERPLPRNALHISGYLAAHTLEFARVTGLAYEGFLGRNTELSAYMDQSVAELTSIMKERLGAVYLEDRPPELRSLVLTHPLDSDKVIVMPLDVQQNGEEAT